VGRTTSNNVTGIVKIHLIAYYFKMR